MSDKPFSIKDMRRDYATRALDEATIDPDPIRQFRLWFDEALQAQVLDANAVAVATVTPDGVPAVRTVLLKDIDQRGLVFFTHYNSPKGQDLASTPHASLLHYWPELERQGGTGRRLVQRWSGARYIGPVWVAERVTK